MQSDLNRQRGHVQPFRVYRYFDPSRLILNLHLSRWLPHYRDRYRWKLDRPRKVCHSDHLLQPFLFGLKYSVYVVKEFY